MVLSPGSVIRLEDLSADVIGPAESG
jgi:hypothetical protein